MFETTTGFLWFFFIMLALILAGIRHEDKLIRLEDSVIRWIKKKLDIHSPSGVWNMSK